MAAFDRPGGGVVPDITPDINLLLSEFGTGGRREQRAAEQKKQQDIQDALGFISSGDPDREEEGLTQIASIQGPAVANSIRATLDRGDQAQIAATTQKNNESLKDVFFLQGIKDPAKRANAITQLGNRPGADLNELMKLQNMDPDQQDLELERDRLSLTALDNVLKERAAKQAFQRDLQKQALAPATLSPGQQRFVEGEVVASVPPTPPKPETRTSLEKNASAAGFKRGTPEFQEFIKQAVNKPATTINLNQKGKPPPGFMWDPKDPDNLLPIKGGAKERETPERAAKIANTQEAIRLLKGNPEEGIPSARDLIFDQNGEVDRTNLINMSLNTPGTEGAQLRIKFEQAMQTLTRNETGAAMPPEEIENTRRRYEPKPTDSKEVLGLKLNALDDVLGRTLKLMDPSGRFETERFQPDTTKKKDFSTMSDEELLKGF